MGQFSRLLALTLIVAAFATPAQAGYMVIDFDDLPLGGSLVPAEYQGITWGTGAKQLATYDSADLWFGSGTYPGTFVMLESESKLLATTTSWTLSSPTGFGGAMFASSNMNTGNGYTEQTIYYKLYDAGNSLIATSPSTVLTYGGGFTWVPSGYHTGNVSKVEVYASPGVWAMDDVTFTPEPCTLALVGLGLAGVGLRRRRSRAGKRRTAAA